MNEPQFIPLLNKISKENDLILSNSSLYFAKFQIFVLDFIFFQPKQDEQILEELKELAESGREMRYSEVAFFDKIMKQLRISKRDSKRIEKSKAVFA